MTDKNDAYLAIDIGGTYIKSAVLNSNGDLYEDSCFRVLSYSNELKDLIIKSIKECVSHSLSFVEKQKKRFSGIGIAIPGPFDYHKGISLMEHKFHALYGEDLKQLLYDILDDDIPIPVCFVHDAIAVLLGEQWKGEAMPFRNSAVITLGTGIGFSHSRNKVVECSPLGSPSVTIYKTPYNGGILEDYVSQRGILETYKELNGGQLPSGITVLDIGRQADNGDDLSISTFRITGSILAESIYEILKQENIECLLLGGQISNAYRHIEETLIKGLSGLDKLSHISQVRSIDHAALYGVLWEILQ